jgi:wyosine [tRNA(Phe)-imidazoG37] synthetase (radical SAM superfamily)
MLAFGPIPSRRLGRSLGINNIPPKVCTYSCIYCQLGHTKRMQIERQVFYKSEEILRDTQKKVEIVKKMDESIDYITFVPDGEPTLDINLGHEIDFLSRKNIGTKTAVITNTSLIWRSDVREDLMKADLISLKMDSTREKIWHRINHPNPNLRLASILNGALNFAEEYDGKLITETMLIDGVNDSEDHMIEVSDFIANLKPAKAYLSIPIRPPADKWVKSPREEKINRIFQIFKKRVENVEYLIGYEGNAFSFTGNIKEDLLSITSVHPMREEAVREFLKRGKNNWSIIKKMIKQGELKEMEYKGKKFYMRKIH